MHDRYDPTDALHIASDATNRSETPPPMEAMYEQWFLEYASYVILERAVPAIEDGLKPVQRRILHAMHLMEDGRYNKVANIVGQTMQYHPHGDSSITEAMVAIGQKELLIDTQGNWGDIRTGDSAAAARYIEARLAPFGKAILYSPEITIWQHAYDGRKKEPRTLPVKFPLLLAQGVEGIAVGLATKILPHNFIELMEAAIDFLQGKTISLLPDFATGGLADCSHYQEGKRGGRVRVRARIEEIDNKTLAIKEIPYGTTTISLIDSILKAHEKGKIKIKNVVDNTAEEIEVLIHLLPDQSAETVIDALYLFTDCEVQYAPNACVIQDEKPVFLTVNELLVYSVTRTSELLKQELLLKQQALEEKLLFTRLEHIFIENKIYKEIEGATTWENVLITIETHLLPYTTGFYRPIVREDIIRLTEIRIKRISKYDRLLTQEICKKLENELADTLHHIAHVKAYTISWYRDILKRYGKGHERKTELTSFDVIVRQEVAIKNQKLYVNRKQGFIGYGLKSEEFVAPCSDIDDVIVIRKDGTCIITKVAEKLFIGNDIVHIGIYEKYNTKRCYHLIYVDGATGIAFAKRFQMLGITRDKDYNLTLGSPGSRIVYISDQPEGEAEMLTILCTPMSKTTKKKFEFDFSRLSIKGRSAKGNMLTKQAIYKVQVQTKGSIPGKSVVYCYHPKTGHITTTGREAGHALGTFLPTDKILLVYKEGYYMTSELPLSVDPTSVLLVEKLEPTHLLSIIYVDSTTNKYFVKRFRIGHSVPEKRYKILPDASSNCIILLATSSLKPQVELYYLPDPKHADKQSIIYNLEQIAIKTPKAKGILLSNHMITEVALVSAS